MSTSAIRLLLKVRPSAALGFARGHLALNGSQFQVEPLFREARPPALGMAASNRPLWLVAEAVQQNTNPWDDAHALASAGEHNGLEYAEPDILNQWHGFEERFSPGLGIDNAACKLNEPDPKWPFNNAVAWHLGDNFSQLCSARKQAGSPTKPIVRIGHLDTGYDVSHITKPQFLDPHGLQRNFVEGGKNAADPAKRGTLRNPGHGTGTLSILAGNMLQGMQDSRLNIGDYLGGAPFAEIVPVRIANSVVHFYTSAMARGIDYLIAPGDSADSSLRCDVISISMGGVPSAAWADAVNRAYDAGVCIVAAAGNNMGGFPTRRLVYPARFGRVIAACGIMADGSPYFRANSKKMQGNFGPSSVMGTAIAAFTPNIPWAELGCSKLVDLDGAGTSSATPQIAAAAALWLQHHNPKTNEPWMRVEAVRHALFSSAKKDASKEKYFGNGSLRASDALKILPKKNLAKTKEDNVFFPFLQILLQQGLTAEPREKLFEVELAQLSQSSADVAALIGDVEGHPTKSKALELFDYLSQVGSPASEALKSFAKGKTRGVKPTSPTKPPAPSAPPASDKLASTRSLPVERPANRLLRAYAFDPTLSLRLENAPINTVTIQVPWEFDRKTGQDSLLPGPVGEYLEVIDIDPASDCAYEPIDLNNPYLLAQDGLTPSEANPQFHQQMVYAVSMKTIKHFEQALGRVVFWSPNRLSNGNKRNEYVGRLRIYPHALREQNAYYSPEKKALLFGYFPATVQDIRKHLPGGMVFTCLSHDIIAHEVTHAILDGIHPRYNESSNPDMLAFHEAFADIVALFQHFTFPEVIRHQIAKTRGDLLSENLLAQLAQQFGQATGGHGALRDFLGKPDETGTWKRTPPDPNRIATTFEPHARGAILVAAVFDAFTAIYRHRTADLLRLATNGTGILPEGQLHPDMVARLSREAVKAAGHILNICIRALDYCPPVDMTFGDYLRAIITADYDLVPNDDFNYRPAIVEAFRNHGIYPHDVRSLSVDSLRWVKPTQMGFESHTLKFFEEFATKIASWRQNSDRETLFNFLGVQRAALKKAFDDRIVKKQGLLCGMKLDQPDIKFEVHSLRPLRRIGPDGSLQTDLLVEITQRRRGYFEPGAQHPETDYQFGRGTNVPEADFIFRGGGTLIVSMETFEVRYYIYKDITNEQRLQKQREFYSGNYGSIMREMYFGSRSNEPFALLHRSTSTEDTE